MRNAGFIAAAVSIAGVFFIVGFFSGGVLHRPNRAFYEGQIADLNAAGHVTNQKLAAAEKEIKASQASVDELSSEIRKLKLEKAALDGRCEILAENLADLEQRALRLDDPKKEVAFVCGNFRFHQVRFVGSYGMTDVRGIVENSSFTDHNSVSFEISVYDERGVILGVGTFYLSSFKSAQKRAFSCSISDVPFSKIKGYKVDVSTLF